MNWMKPKGALAVSDRQGAISAVLSAVLVFAGLCMPALAGDRALLDVIGFSPDARYFAFEEYGIQDGSGFAYSTIYLVDLTSDSWVVGTPIRAQAFDDGRGLADTSAESARNFAAHRRDFDITTAADIVAMIGDGVPGSDGKSLTFGRPGYTIGDVLDTHHLTLRSFETAAANPCGEWVDNAPMGMELVLSDAETDRVVARDGTLPRSRGCPVDYRLHAVVLPFESFEITKGVAMVAYYPHGFEGPDRRFLAVPLAP